MSGELLPKTSKTALVAVSYPGGELAHRLQQGLHESALFLPERFSPADGTSVHHWRGRLGDLIEGLFKEYHGIVLFGALGMAVRLIAPLARDKRTDPAVVVVDDAGRFAVSLLSGHLGGANALARRVAELLGAQPVITTGSEALGTLAVDLLGREFGWRLERWENVTRVSAAVVNGEPVALLQEAGELHWWPREKALPPNLIPCSTPEELAASACRAALIISDRTLAEGGDALPPAVVYRPRSLVAGIGCNRGASAEEIEATVMMALHEHGLAPASLRKLATVDLKRNEEGLCQWAEKMEIPIEFFTTAELAGVQGLPSPSAVVHRWMGIRGVCEPAALLSSGARELLVPKVKSANVTVAIARIDFSRIVGD
ncbi:MAG: cobalt-precorrin 5A hydrolase [Chloroflexota bacterium]